MNAFTVVLPTERDPLAAALRVVAYATMALAPVEGYLTAVHPQAGKVAPVLLIAGWLALRIRQRTLPRLTPLQVVLASLGAVVATTAAVHSAEAFTVEYTLRWFPFLLVTAVLADIAGREVPLRGLLLATVAGATVAGAGALYSLLVEGNTRASGPQPDPNDLAYFLVAAVPMLFLTPGVSRFRGFAITLAGTVLVGGAIATFSRGGALALAAALAWLLVRRVLPWRVLAAAAASVVVLGLAVLLLAGPRLERAVQEKTFIAATNVDTRELRWQAAARMVAAHPVLGVGPGSFRTQYAAASHNAEIDEQTPVAHNMYLEVAAELGLPGFALFAGVLGTAVLGSERAVRCADRPSPARTEAIVIQAALLAVLVASAFLSEQYYLPLWSLAALGVAAGIRTGKAGADACPARDQ